MQLQKQDAFTAGSRISMWIHQSS